jgi:hypothetical protein
LETRNENQERKCTRIYARFGYLETLGWSLCLQHYFGEKDKFIEKVDEKSTKNI